MHVRKQVQVLSQQLEDERKTYRKTREEMEQMREEMEKQEDQIEKLKSEVVSRNSEILAGKHQINMLSMLLSQKCSVCLLYTSDAADE